MQQEQSKQKIMLAGGLILVVIVSLGGYLYNDQQNRMRSIAYESEAVQKNLNEELSNSRLQIDQLNKSLQLLSQEQSILEAKLAAETASRQQLEAELENTRESKQQVEQAMQAELQNLATTSSQLEQELQQRQAQQAKLDNKIEAASGEKQQLLARLESERERRRQLQREIDQVSDEISTRENALTEAEQAAEQLNRQLQQTQQEQDQLRQKIAAINQQRQQDSQHFAELEQRLKQELNESRFEISQLKNRMTVIKLTSEVLFNSGSAEIKLAGKEVLSLIAESLNRYPDRNINIEGHTDSIPIGKNSPYTSNWELSTARALAAVDYFQQNRQIDPKRLTVVGRGEHHPVANNETVEGRQLNRRIEIRLLPDTSN